MCLRRDQKLSPPVQNGMHSLKNIRTRRDEMGSRVRGVFHWDNRFRGRMTCSREKEIPQGDTLWDYSDQYSIDFTDKVPESSTVSWNFFRLFGVVLCRTIPSKARSEILRQVTDPSLGSFAIR